MPEPTAPIDWAAIIKLIEQIIALLSGNKGLHARAALAAAKGLLAMAKLYQGKGV